MQLKKAVLGMGILFAFVAMGCDDGGSGDLCGDGKVDPGEECDSGELVGRTCQDFGYKGGFLNCSQTCRYDFSQCVPMTCGDGSVDSGEECDGSDLDGKGCADFGYQGGQLGCLENCRYDFSQCEGGECGNGIREAGEECDGTDFGMESCATLGYAKGVLACTSDCRLDTSGCETGSPVCGNGVREPGEECDGADLGDATSCESLGYYGGTLGCSRDCTYDLEECEAWGRCGDGIIQDGAGEQCDTLVLGGARCEDFGYSGGRLGCSPECRFDFSECKGTGSICGNGRREGTEVCDGTDLAGETCETQGYDGGVLGCSPDCTSFDVSGCGSSGLCGNGVLDPGEVCDGTAPFKEDCFWAVQGAGCSASCDAIEYSQCSQNVRGVGSWAEWAMPSANQAGLFWTPITATSPSTGEATILVHATPSLTEAFFGCVLTSDPWLVCAGDHMMYAVNTSDGSVIWSRDLSQDMGQDIVMGGPVLLDGGSKVVALRFASGMMGYSVDDGHPLGGNPISGSMNSQDPVVGFDGNVYTGGGSVPRLLGVSPTNGATVLDLELPIGYGDVVGPVLDEKGMLVAAVTSSGTAMLYLVDATSQQVVDDFPLGSDIVGSAILRIAYWRGRVILVTNPGNANPTVYIYDLWTRTIESVAGVVETVAALAVDPAEDRLYVMTTDGNLYAVSMVTGGVEGILAVSTSLPIKASLLVDGWGTVILNYVDGDGARVVEYTFDPGTQTFGEAWSTATLPVTERNVLSNVVLAPDGTLLVLTVERDSLIILKRM